MIIADKYQQKILKMACAKYQALTINDETCFDCAIAGELLNIRLLKDTSSEYIIKHKNKLLNGPEWEFIRTHYPKVSERWHRKAVRMRDPFLIRCAVFVLGSCKYFLAFLQVSYNMFVSLRDHAIREWQT